MQQTKTITDVNKKLLQELEEEGITLTEYFNIILQQYLVKQGIIKTQPLELVLKNLK